MSKYLLLPVLAVFLAACGTTSVATPAPRAVAARPGAVTVEVAYLNHPPLRPVLSEVDKLLANYGDRVSVTRYDFDTPEGEAFAKAKELTGHTPLAIFVNGSMQFTLNGRTVKFYSFPQGQGTGMVPDGGWTIQDLQQVLDEAAGKSS
jgi:hypothetical protein